jgi:hypothetical protein
MGQWRKEQLLRITEGYKYKDIYSAEMGLFFRLLPNKTLSLKGITVSGENNSKERKMMLLACNADWTDKLLSLITGKSENPYCFKNVRELPTKHLVTREAWIPQVIFAGYLRVQCVRCRP